MKFPGYDIERTIGQGGMGKVFQVRNTGLDRLEVIKVIHEHILDDPEYETKVRARFENEQALHGRMEHSGIVRVYNCGALKTPESARELPYLVMEYLPGGDLKQRLKARGGRPFAIEEAVRIIRALAEALAYAHGQNIIHRDIKPSNIIFDRDDHPKLADFGVSRLISLDSAYTTHVVGTYCYMSPEQFEGRNDRRADLYSLGCVLFEMLTGMKAFHGDMVTLAVAKNKIDSIPLLPPGVQKFQPLMDKLLAVDPDQRFATAEEFIQELDKIDQLPEVQDPDGETLLVTPLDVETVDADMEETIAPPNPAPAKTDAQQSGITRRKILIGVTTLALATLAGVIVYNRVTPPPPELPVEVWEIRVRRLISEGQCQAAADSHAEGLRRHPEAKDLRDLGARLASCEPTAA